MTDETSLAVNDVLGGPNAKIVLLASDEVCDELESFGEIPDGLWGQHSGRLEDIDDVHFQKALTCLPESLLFWGALGEGQALAEPVRAADDPENRDLWRRLLHRLTGRLLVRLVFVGEGDDLKQLLRPWQERFQQGVLPEVQTDFRSAWVQVVIVVFTREVRPEDATAFNALATAGPGSEATSTTTSQNSLAPRILRIYVMGSRLRMGQGEAAPPVLSRHVWPLAVSRLLLRLLAKPPDPHESAGLWAWRCVDFAPDLNQPLFDQLLAQQWEQLVEELFRVPNSPAADAGPISPVGDLPSLALLRPQGGKDHEQRMVDFGRLDGLRECEGHVQRETSDDTWKQILFEAGRQYQLQRNRRDGQSTSQLHDELTRHWHKVAETPGWLRDMMQRGFGWARQLRLKERIEQQHQRWDSLLHGGRDLFERKERLRVCAQELDRARRGFVGFMARALFALVTGLLLAFSATAVVRIWMIAWRAASGPGNEIKRLFVYLGVALAVAAGCTAGAFLPYWMELRQGRKGGRHLQRELGLVRADLETQIRDRQDLCAQGDTLRLEAWGLAATEFQRRLAARADMITRQLLRAFPGDRTADDTADAEPFRSSILRQKDRHDYRHGTTLRVGQVTDRQIESVVASGTEARQRHWRQPLLDGWRRCCACDQASRGWLPWRVLEQRLGTLGLNLRARMEATLTEDMIEAEGQAMNLSAAECQQRLRECFGRTRTDWPFLSVPALAAEQPGRHPVFLATRSGVDAMLIEDGLRGYYQADVTPLGGAHHGGWSWQLPILAFIFEEMRVEIREKDQQAVFYQATEPGA